MTTKTFLWNEAPFLRLLPPLMAGIAAGWYLKLSLLVCFIVLLCCFAVISGYLFLSLHQKRRLRWLGGAALLMAVAAIGALLVRQANIIHKTNWLGNHYRSGDAVIAVLHEPLVPKPASYKAVLRITHVLQNNRLQPVTGKAIVYFQKTEAIRQLRYGTTIIFQKGLQPISNSGNPGAFDYRRYNLFQGITHQVFLSEADFKVVPYRHMASLRQLVFKSRTTVVRILQTHISGSREQGLAEALLIGYKDDLDKALVEAYTNTGVVHVIAISGLHLGLIYGLLVLLLRPLRQMRLLRFLLILAGLWGFSFLAGAQPSVLRSAVMFSCIALGELMGRKSTILNTLAFSAFGLLLYNPFWLWDLGFQLSYAAVASIVVFYQPLYHLLYFPNKALDWVWKLVALTLTAQVFTLPVSLYHFHQFPLLFLATNLVAVPLSSLILIGEILLCAFSFWPAAANIVGVAVEWMIELLNGFINRLSHLPFAVWDGFSLSTLQTILLYIAIGGLGTWLLVKNRLALKTALLALLLFVAWRSFSFYTAKNQRLLIVYNVPKRKAVDMVAGRQVYFWGDAVLLQEGVQRNFHLKPSRIQLRAAAVQAVQGKAFRLYNKTVALLDSNFLLPAVLPHVLIVSGKALLPGHYFMQQEQKVQVVLDATVPPWRIAQWRQLCAATGWPLHNVKEDGAFQMRW